MRLQVFLKNEITHFPRQIPSLWVDDSVPNFPISWGKDVNEFVIRNNFEKMSHFPKRQVSKWVELATLIDDGVGAALVVLLHM